MKDKDHTIRKDHTVSYTPTEYYSMCEKSKKRVKEMQERGIPTKYDSKENPEEMSSRDEFLLFYGK